MYSPTYSIGKNVSLDWVYVRIIVMLCSQVT